ncbi:MAG: HAMP domain-containing sensor histidine kinase [bacterium]
MNSFITRFLGGIKGLLFVFAVGVGLTLHIYTQHIVDQLRDEARSLVQFYARWYARVTDTETENLDFLFEQIILKTNFPLILTDSDKNPTGWKGIDVDSTDFSDEALRRVKRMVERMDKEIDPVPISYENIVLGYLYYGDSRLIQQLQWLPYVEVGIIGLFILVGFFGYANIKRSEQRHIWVGMAKETAHQLGTPISSLMGWLEVMRSEKRPEKDQILSEIEKDLRRLSQVTERFSQIGSKPDLKKIDIRDVLGGVAEYIRRRAPLMGRLVNISESYGDVPLVAINRGLLQWAVENVLKNSLDAMDKEEGIIEIRLGSEENDGRIFIEIEDNGKGMDKIHKKRVFKPGYSTKQRGWGLGLTLARRIVEEYHGGKLFIKETKPGEGTTLRIELNC